MKAVGNPRYLHLAVLVQEAIFKGILHHKYLCRHHSDSKTYTLLLSLLPNNATKKLSQLYRYCMHDILFFHFHSIGIKLM